MKTLLDFEKSRRELLSYGCSCVRCKLNWNSVVLFLRRVEIQNLTLTLKPEKNLQSRAFAFAICG